MKVYVVITTNQTPYGASPYCRVFMNVDKAAEYADKENKYDVATLQEHEVLE